MERESTTHTHNDHRTIGGRDAIVVNDIYSNMRSTTRLIPSRANNLGVLLLDNPKALHALTRDMVDCADDVLREWKSDPTIKAILIKSSSKETKRASFCAGGDVKSVYLQGLEYQESTKERRERQKPEIFFRHEYKVIHKIATCIDKIPVVSFWDGLVMGGGVGLSIHGKYRVATERTLFSMPECRIGFFPDVGSMWWMTRLLQRPMANYLALTGQRLKPSDLLYTGLATHYVSSNRIEDLEHALVEANSMCEKDDQEAGDVIASVLTSFHESIPTDHCDIAINKEIIERTFTGDSVEELCFNLKEADTEFSKSALNLLKEMSPTSLKITMEGLNRGVTCKTIAEDLQMEYRMAKASVQQGSDFYEGIRSVLVDKDNSPKWKPANLEEVTDGMIYKFFSPMKNNEWTHLQEAEPSKL